MANIKNVVLSQRDKTFPLVPAKKSSPTPWLRRKHKGAKARKDRAYAILMKTNTPAHLAVFKKEAAYLHHMIRSARLSYESRLALASSKSPKPFFAYVRRKRELRQEIESIIVDGVEKTQPAVLSEAFRSYFSSAFRNDGGEDPPLNYPANNHMQQFMISTEDVRWQLTRLNTNKSEGADKIHPKILASLASFWRRHWQNFTITQ